jgi:hypothetical protein
MAGGQAHRVRAVLLGCGIAMGALASAVMPATLAGAATKSVLIGNGTSVTIASGWSAGKPSGGVLDVTHKSPNAVLAIEVETGVTASTQAQGNAVFSSLEKQLSLAKVKVMGLQSSAIPGTGKFNEAYGFTYTATRRGQKLGGIVVQLQNSKTGDGCFAIVVAKQSDKPKLKNAVNLMLNSLANN